MSNTTPVADAYTPVVLTKAEIAEMLDAVESKAATIRTGFYDDYKGEIKRRNSKSRKWADDMDNIGTILRSGDLSGLDREDWVEIYYSGISEALQEKIGADGETATEEGAMVEPTVNFKALKREEWAELVGLLRADIYTDAHEYSDRVERIRELVRRLT